MCNVYVVHSDATDILGVFTTRGKASKYIKDFCTHHEYFWEDDEFTISLERLDREGYDE